ncbi:MAG: hypothetical protein ACOYXM_17880 [Actinomycetota bacterium]
MAQPTTPEPTTPEPTTPEPEPIEPVSTQPKPISPRQLAANRRNAQKSTGPTGRPGKARVSRNAVKHGIYADVRPITHGAYREDPLAVQAMVDDVIDTLKPRNDLERAAAVRIATVQLQIGRHHAFETAELETLTSTKSFAHLDGPGVFEAQFTVELYEDVSEVLTHPPSTYTVEEWLDLLLVAAAYDPDLRELNDLLDLEDPQQLAGSEAMILSSITKFHGGSLPAASRSLADIAKTHAGMIPDADTEQANATAAIRFAVKKGSLEGHSRIHARLSAALDRELKRFKTLRDLADEAPDTDYLDDLADEEEMYDDYRYNNPS